MTYMLILKCALKLVPKKYHTLVHSLAILVNMNKYLCYTSFVDIFILTFYYSKHIHPVHGTPRERIIKSW